MTAATWWLQAAYLLGFLAFSGAGSSKRWWKVVGWATGVISEGCFTAWAYLAHFPTAYPWIVAWGGVYIYNTVKWTRETNAVSERT